MRLPRRVISRNASKRSDASWESRLSPSESAGKRDRRLSTDAGTVTKDPPGERLVAAYVLVRRPRSRRDEQLFELVAAEAAARHVGGGQLDDRLQSAVGCIA